MSRVTRPLGLAVLVLLLSSVRLPADEGIELRWGFKKGQTFKYLMKHHEVRTLVINTQTAETTADLDLDWQWTVGETDDKGVATIDAKLAGLKADIKGKDYALTYDSAGKNTSEDEYTKSAFAYFDQLRFARYRLRLTPEGRVAELTGFDKVVADLGADNKAPFFNGLNLRDDTYRWYLQQALGVLPESKVAEGGKWKEPLKTKLAGFGEMSGETRYRLDKPAKSGDVPCQVIRFEGTQALDLELALDNLTFRGPLKFTKVDGAVRFDPKAKAVHDSEYKTEISGKLSLTTNADGALEVTIKQTVSLEAKP